MVVLTKNQKLICFAVAVVIVGGIIAGIVLSQSKDPAKPSPKPSPKPTLKAEDKEVYYYDIGRYSFPQMTTNVGEQVEYRKKNKETAEKLGAVQASKDQIIAEWKTGLDACNYAWSGDTDETFVFAPYRTTRGSGSGCEKTNVLSGEIPSASGLQGTKKWGLWLYGKKPDLPTCDGSSITACVGKYSPTKKSKYSP